MKYVICAKMYAGTKLNGKDICYKQYGYLGCEGEKRIYVYEETPTDKTLLFDLKEEAKDYIKLHELNKHIGIEKHIVETIEFY